MDRARSDNPSGASRRSFLKTAALGGAAATMASQYQYPALAAAREIAQPPQSPDILPFVLDEITISDLQDGMKSGKNTASSLVEIYTSRIGEIDKHGPSINSVIELNPDAASIAEILDQERKAKGARGPLHGVPVLIKDNIDTADRMMTTAGSLALVGSKPAKDSFVAQQLRAAGAVSLGKTNLSEWANIRSSHSTSGWSGRGGLTKNPYALDRNPCGSSSGSGAAASANLAAGTVGTETDGSIVCPSSANGIVGIKPTVGLISRAGIIPISHSQDGAGPMGRRGTDAPVLRAGAVIVDPADVNIAANAGALEFTVLLYELKSDLNAYLARLGPSAPVK